MDSRVTGLQFGTHNSIGRSMMQILCNFWCETQTTKSWSTEGDISHKTDNSTAVADEGKLNPSNGGPANATSTEAYGDPKLPHTPLDTWLKGKKYSDEASGDPKPPYTHLNAWVKEAKYSDKCQREYAPKHISK